MPGHLSAAYQTSRQHKCENASTLCSGIKPRQPSAGRPPPGPQIPRDADAGLRRPRKGWRAGVLLAPDVGIATCALPRGALALAAVTEAPVVGGRAAVAITGAGGGHCRPDKLGGEEGLRFRRRAWCRNIQYGGPCEGGSANFQRRGARVSHPWVHGGQAWPGDAGEAGVRVAEYLLAGEGRSAERWRGVCGSQCQCRGQAGRASTSPSEAGRGRAGSA